MRYEKGFRLPKERVGELRSYFTERVSVGAVGSSGYAPHVASTDPLKLHAQERYLEEVAQAAARSRRIEAVYRELHATRPKLAEVAWKRLEIAYGPVRKEDPHEHLRELAGLARYTDAAIERARMAWSAWILAKKPWNTPRAQARHRFLSERLRVLQEEARDAGYPGSAMGAIALFEQRYLYPRPHSEKPVALMSVSPLPPSPARPEEPTLEELHEVAEDVIDRACATYNEALLRAIVHQADKMLSDASRALDVAWTNVEAETAAADEKRRKGDGKGAERLARMAEIRETIPPPEAPEYDALIDGFGRILDALRTRDGAREVDVDDEEIVEEETA